MTSLFADLDLRECRLDHPDAVALIDAVQRFYVGLYGGPDTTPIDPAEMARPDGTFCLGYLQEVPVTMGGWRFSHEPIAMPVQRPAELKRMYVVPAYRGRGLARDLLQYLESSASAAGADAMVLETGRPQFEAVTLYRACGYADIERFGHYQAEPDAVHLGKLLGPA